MLEFLETKLFRITAAAVAIYAYFKFYVLTYWQRRGVPCEPPSLILGNIPFAHFAGKISIGDFVKENYEKFSKHPFHGFYTFHRPAIVINDPELLKVILIKEFQKFEDRGWFQNDKVDELSGHLFFLSGERWRNLRAKLSPTFTSGKLKQMYQLFAEVSKDMIDVCEAELKHSNVLEVKNIIGRYTIDIISSVVYGLKSSSLKNSKDDFRDNGIEALIFNRLSLLVGIFIPEILDKFSLPLSKGNTRKFFINIFKNMVDYRRKENIMRKDFLNLLMQLMDHDKLEDDEGKTTEATTKGMEKLNVGVAAAQAFVFFIAGYETASSTATYCLLELAMNPDVQDKLRKEINKMEETTGITYDSIMGNQYLDMVLSETLRKYPSVPILNRICLEDFPIPDSNYTIPKGMRVIISASGIHRNPEFYPNPDLFDPMRFSKDNASGRSNCVQLGFGEGPRFCIGKRFGQLEAKLAIAKMIRHYKFSISEKTEIPVKYATDVLVQSPASGIYLQIDQRFP